ncbi:MAG: right-handed parallel beta-helix repeat-containing protein [Planctomycetota bacterium]|nr:right-handed parallel beta-helix repeat-containing protein [Planctomycetota bacterium]
MACWINRALVLLVCLISSRAFASTQLTAQQIEDLVNQASANHQTSVTIPPGTYSLSADTSLRYHLQFQNLQNLTIDATGVTLVCTNTLIGGVFFSGCANVTFQGATIVYPTPCFTQGVVLGVGPGASYIDVKIDLGWPSNLDNPTFFPQHPAANIFDPSTRLWKRGVDEPWLKAPQRLGPRRFRIPAGRAFPADSAPINAGDLIAFRGVGSNGVLLYRCTGMLLDELTVMSAGGYGIYENGGGGNRYHAIQVTYGPTPPTATTAPLLSANADGFHSTASRTGPMINNCLFEGMPDDGIAIHGLFAMVVASSANSVTVGTVGVDSVQPGDWMRLSSADGGFLADAQLISRQELPGYQPPHQITNPAFARTVNYHTFVMDRPLAAVFGELLGDNNASGAGYVISNCTIRNNRARGMIVQGGEGLIQNNLIDGSTMEGILVGPEISTNVAGYMRNLMIRHNTIHNVCYATFGANNPRPGAITIAGEGQDTAAMPGHIQISVHNNLFSDIDGVNLMIDSVRGALIRNNTFTNPQAHPTVRGLDAGIDPDALIYLNYCDNVQLDDNVITSVPPASLEPVVATPSVTNIIGATTGVIVGAE